MLPNSDRVTLRLTAHGGDVQIGAVAWERLIPTENVREDTSYIPGEERAAAQAWFGAPLCEDGKSRASRDIVLPASACGTDLVFKVLGRDLTGKMVAAWARLCHNDTSVLPAP